MKNIFKDIVLVTFFFVPLLLFFVLHLDDIYLSELFSISDNIFSKKTILNTFIISFFGSLFSCAIGFSLALTFFFIDPFFKKFFHLFMFFPMALPPFILAYFYTDWFDLTSFFYKKFESYQQIQWLNTLKIPYIISSIMTFVITVSPYSYFLFYVKIQNIANKYFFLYKELSISKINFVKKVILPLTKNTLLVSFLISFIEIFSNYPVLRYFHVETVVVRFVDMWGLSARKIDLIHYIIFIFTVSILISTLLYKKIQNDKYSNVYDKNVCIDVPFLFRLLGTFFFSSFLL